MAARRKTSAVAKPTETEAPQAAPAKPRAAKPKADKPKADTPKAAKAKAPKPQGQAVAALVADQPISADPALVLRKKELVARVALAAGLRPHAARPLVEATLAALGQALSDGETLVLPPFGKIRATRRRDKPEGSQTLTLRLRRPANQSGNQSGNQPEA